jgi:hypothetical protein
VWAANSSARWLSSRRPADETAAKAELAALAPMHQPHTWIDTLVSLMLVRTHLSAALAEADACAYPAACAKESRITTTGTNLRDTASSDPKRVLSSCRHALSAISAIGMRTLVSRGDRKAATSESS